MGGLFGGGGAGYSPQPYDNSRMQAAFEKQNAGTQSIMADMLKQQQDSAFLSSQQQAQNLAAQNQAQQQNYTAAIQSNLPAKATPQSISNLTSPVSPMQNQFQMPNTSGIQFGGY